MFLKHVVQEKARVALALFRKSSRQLESFKEGSEIVNALNSLRSDLRDQEGQVQPFQVYAPFLRILRSPQLPGTFMAVALDAIQTFVSCNIVSKICEAHEDLMLDVIEAVSRCKFALTDKIGDKLVKLSCIQILHDIPKSAMRCALSDEAIWALMDSCFSLLLSLGAKNVQSQLYQLTEKTLMDSVRFIFSSIFDPVGDQDSTSKSAFGLPCAMKIVGFLVNVIAKHSPRSSSLPFQSRNYGASGSEMEARNKRMDNDQELILALKTVQCLLCSNGQPMKSRAIVLRCPELASLVRDDLSRCIVMIAANHSHGTNVLHQVLDVFITLWYSMGPVMKVLIECFSLHVFMKAFHQLLFMLEIQHEQQQLGIATSSVDGITTDSDQFSLDDLEVIFDCFLDLMGDPNYLTSMFSSFDCDPTKPDIVQPLFKYISKCSSFLLSSPGSSSMTRRRLKSLFPPANMAVKIMVQASKALSQRCGENMNTSKHEKDWHIYKQQYENVLVFPKSPVRTTLEIKHDQKMGCFYSDLNNCSPDLISQKLHTDLHSKAILRDAASRFAKKPRLGLMFLQEIGALETPMTPSSCAKFLRVACGLGCLSKADAGAYLGDLGKEDGKEGCHESESANFHKDVLWHYVRTFEFEDQGFLNCMRIFLSAFRLPGEAMQIDRILVAFSEHAITRSKEGKSGVLQNVDVGFLLSFSIIMLNTDLHNPSIKEERKMKIDQFIKYNTNYGRDINQTINIPRDFLEHIYNNIAAVPLRTEENDIHGVLTSESWMEYQLQTLMNPECGFMITTSFSPESFVEFRHCAIGKSTSRLKQDSPSEPHKQRSSPREENIGGSVLSTFRLLNTDAGVCPLQISSCLYGASWIVDADLVSCLWMPFLSVAISPFLRQEHQPPPSTLVPVPSTPDRPRRSTSVDNVATMSNSESGNTPKARKPVDVARVLHPSAPESSVAIGEDLLMSITKLCHTQGITSVVDAVIMLLADMAGLGNGNTVDSVVHLLQPLGPMSSELHAGIGYLHEGVTVPIDFKRKLKEKMLYNAERKSNGTYRKRYSDTTFISSKSPDSSEVASSESENNFQKEEDLLPYHVSLEYLATLMTFPPAMVALRSLIKIATQSPHAIGKKGWATIWHVMGVMRDFTALPPSMVCTDDIITGLELLHPRAREDFEAHMAVNRARELIRLREPSLQAQLRALTKSSVLSFQGIGEALFGGREEKNESWIETELILRQNQERKSALEGLQSVVAGRWDAGYYKVYYDGDHHECSRFDDDLSYFEFSYTPPPFPTEAIEEEGWYEYVCDLGRRTILELRKMMDEENVEQLILESKFYEDKSMMTFLDALCRSAERESLIYYSTTSADVEESPSSNSSRQTNDEREDFVHVTLPAAESLSNTDVSREFVKGLHEIENILNRESYAEDQFSKCLPNLFMPLPTEASASWLEVVVVAVALRNRDRMSLIWPMLADHYKRAFALDGVGASMEPEEESKNYNASRRGVEVVNGDGLGVCTPISLSRATTDAASPGDLESLIIVHSIDKRVAGLFKIATRMMSRKQLLGPTIDLVSSIFGKCNYHSRNEMSGAPNSSKSIITHIQDSFTGNVEANRVPVRLSPSDYVLYQISGQVASGMWMMLTQNVLMLPYLELQQWQAIFDVMSIAARGGAFSAIKCFETMAWLIHEPNLRAEVPVFCVRAVTPLVLNPNAPDSVAIGALHLLLHLHGRLEVLLKDTDSTEGTPALWESCWIPILQSISLGAVDSSKPGRPRVKRSAVNVLCATILDRHASGIPVSVLVEVMLDIVIPTANKMGQALVNSVRDGSYLNSCDADSSKASVNEDEYNLSKELYCKSIGNFGDIDSATTRHQLLTGGSADAGPTAILLKIITKVSLLHMHRLVQYPGFEHFWKELLGVFTFYLDAAPPLGLGFDSGLIKVCPELKTTADTATEQLKELLPVLKNSDYFVTFSGEGCSTSNSYSSSSYNQLWIITRQATGNLERCPDLFDELFPGSA